MGVCEQTNVLSSSTEYVDFLDQLGASYILMKDLASSSSFTHLCLGLLKSAFNKYIELHIVGLNDVLIQFYLC